MCIQLWQGANAGKIRTAVGVSSCSPGWSNPCGCCAVGGCSVHRSWRCSCEPMGICSAKFLVALLGSVSFLFNALLSPTVVGAALFCSFHGDARVRSIAELREEKVSPSLCHPAQTRDLDKEEWKIRSKAAWESAEKGWATAEEVIATQS